MTMDKSETKFGNYFKLPNPNLRSYFSRVVKGQPDVYRTPFYGKNTPASVVLNNWIPKLESLEKKFPTLVEFEMDLAKKVGPLSVMRPLSERITDIDSYYDSVLPESEPIHPVAIDAVTNEWSVASGMRLRSQRRTVDLMKKSTSSGSPFFTKRRNVVDITVPCAFERMGDDYIQSLPWSTWATCAILGWRGQEGGPKPEDVKQRVVWMFPFAVNIHELRAYQVLIETFQRFDLVPAWVSQESVDAHITQLFDTKSSKDLIVCTDFSKFDQHFNENMSSCALTILSRLFTKTPEFEDWSSSIFPIKYNIPLAYDWGKIRYGKHGMGSGSGGTNADETLAHRALQHEAAIMCNQSLNPHSMCLGDDGILTYPGIDVEDVTRLYSSHGQDMNIDKQYASTDDCTYLRRWHHKDYRIDGVCVGVYSTARALGKLLYQERYYEPDVWGPEMVALRQLSIIENVKFHPLREEFAEYCMKGDKYRLGIDIPGFLDHIDRYAQKANDYMPDFLGYTKSSMALSPRGGIQDWWIVNYLKSKA